MGIGGRLLDMAEAAILTEAEVVGVERLTETFVRIELSSAAFRDARWTAGAKVQVRPPGDGRGLRTYTPLDWDNERGRTRLLAYLHGDGPASTWFRQVRGGEAVRLMGPRRSIDAPVAGERILFAGDASSVALACAFDTTGAEITYLFEEPVADALGALGAAPGAEICEPAALLDRLRAAAAAIAGPYRLVVTGDAATVHAVRRDVRGWATPPTKISGKAYWAAGRTGLD